MLNTKNMRKSVLIMGHAAAASGAHLGGSLSLIEIMAALYGGAMHFNPDRTESKRDRLILSKGHGVMAQYAALAELGILSPEDLLGYKKDGSILGAHPAVNSDLGVDFASGSLGQGLSLGVGTALALLRKGDLTTRVFVILGDGECDEGQVWEAAMAAAHFKLKNIIAIIDANSLQYDGPTKDIMDLGSLANKWESFGWRVISVDGHDPEALQTILKPSIEAPLAVIAQTIKGKGVSFMENIPAWHNGILSKKLFEAAMSELEREDAGIQ